jgi:pyrroline-5-carboxylate reductase
VRVTDDNAVAARGADVIVLAVKPQMMRKAAEDIRTANGDERPLLISVAA